MSDSQLFLIYSAGRGALARRGDFFYPVRLIQKLPNDAGWRVRWWRENVYISDRPEPVSIVKGNDLVDSLWLDRETRRKTRVCIH